MARALSDAIIYNQMDVVKQLIAKGTDVNDTDDYGYTPLNEAAIANNLEAAQLLLQHGAKVNEADVVGNTPLAWAAENNNIPLCKLLLSNGANPNAYTSFSQPILVKPLLRRQHALKELLYQHGADLKFAQDYIYTKLIGHRFELTGRVDIVDNKGKFIEIDFEGFILEFSLDIIFESLLQFRNNYAGRSLRPYFDHIQLILDAFTTANELIRYQQYMVKREQHQDRIEALLQNELLLIPIGSEGHAITFIRYGNLLAKCDRGENSLHEPSVCIYWVHRPFALNAKFWQQLLYQKQSRSFINEGIKQALGLEMVASLPLPSQITGNCSWANVEGSIATMLFMLMGCKPQTDETAITIFNQWREWDKDRALHEMIENFYSASPARKASLASTLAAILVQTCDYNDNADLPRINKIMSLFRADKEYDYILRSYVKVYCQENKTKLGENLLQLLDIAQ